MRYGVGLFAGEFFFECCECFEVAESGFFDSGSSGGSFGFGFAGLTFGFAFSACFSASFVFEDAAVGEDDAFGFFVELDNLEGKFFVNGGGGAVFFNEVFGSGEAFYAVGESNDSAFVEEFDDGAFVNATNGEDGFEYVPGIFFELLVAEAKATVFFVDSEYFHFDVVAYLSKFAGVFDFLGPAEVGDVDQTVYTFLKLYEYTEVGEVAHASGVA